MSEIENRLRAAFAADAETISPFSVRAIDLSTARRRLTIRRPRPGFGRADDQRRGRVLVPAIAAVSIAVVAVGATIAVPKLGIGRDGHEAALPAALAGAYPGGRVPTASPPRFIVMVVAGGPAGRSSLAVVNSATGRVTGHLAAPNGQSFWQVSNFGSDRRFAVIVAAKFDQSPCVYETYEFRLTATGHPVGLAKAPDVGSAAENFPSLMASSSNGHTLATAQLGCFKPPYAGVNSLAFQPITTGSVRHIPTWTIYPPSTFDDLSLSGDGKVAALTGSLRPHGSLKHPHGPITDGVWIVGSATLGKSARVITVPGASTDAGLLSPTGRVTYIVSTGHSGNTLRVGAYRTGTGALIKMLYTASEGTPPARPVPTLDHSGRYLLMPAQTRRGTRLDPIGWLDTATGRFTTVPRISGIGIISAAW